MPRSSRTAFIATLVCAGWLLLTTLAVRLSTAVKLHDLAALQSFRRLDHRQSSATLSAAASVGDPLPYALVGIGLGIVLLAIVRGHGRLALTIALLLCVTTAGAEALKLGLSQGSMHSRSFPSGHATAAFSLALCAVLAAPARLMPVAVSLGVIFAAGVSYVVIALGWHTPSDVVGGFLVAATVTGIAITVLLLLEEHADGDRSATLRTRRGAWRWSGVGAVAVAGTLTLTIVVPVGSTDLLASMAAVAIAALATTLLFVFGRLAG